MQQLNVQLYLDDRPLSGKQWLVFVLGVLIILADGLDSGAIGFIAPSLLSAWGIDKPALAPVVSASLVGMAIGALVAGPLRREERLIFKTVQPVLPPIGPVAQGAGGMLLRSDAFRQPVREAVPAARPLRTHRTHSRTHRHAAAPIFPREIAVPVLPTGLGIARLVQLARQRQIADGDGAHAHFLRAVAVGKGIELLHKTQRVVGLRLHPGAQARLQRAVVGGERPGWQRSALLRGQNAWLPSADRHQHCDQIGLHRMLLALGLAQGGGMGGGGGRCGHQVRFPRHVDRWALCSAQYLITP